MGTDHVGNLGVEVQVVWLGDDNALPVTSTSKLESRCELDSRIFSVWVPKGGKTQSLNVDNESIDYGSSIIVFLAKCMNDTIPQASEDLAFLDVELRFVLGSIVEERVGEICVDVSKQRNSRDV